MSNAITMGIFWHLIGAASAACFYAPFKKVKKWSWETMWSVGGIVSWIILPWAISALLLPNFWAYYSSFSLSTLLPVFLFGAMWGIGNINYGLTMRYLGMSMGIGIAIGITLIVGTLMTPIINGNFDVLINTEGGRMTLLGVLVALMIQPWTSQWMDMVSIYLCPLGAFTAGVMFFWVMKKDTALEAAQLGDSKPLMKWFYPFGRYVFVPLCLLCFVLGIAMGGIG